MKNTHSPTPENFILTCKKIRMIKALMKQFVMNYSIPTFLEENYIPERQVFETYMKERLKFLKNIEVHYYIEVINGLFTGIYFKYEGFCVFAETPLRKNFFKPVDMKHFVRIDFRGLKIKNQNHEKT